MRESREEGAGAMPVPELRETDEGLALVSDGMELRGDFSRMLPRLRADRLGRELLVRAARVKGADAPTVFDATAGLGEDGFEVTLCEHDSTIAALLRDVMARAAEIPKLADAVGRMRVLEADSLEVLPSLVRAPDVVYLDPMFPARTKSAAVKKKFQLLHRLEPPCEDAEALLRAAVGAGPRKVVIKRPVKGPLLAGIKPSYSLAGKAVRYDVIVPVR